MSGNESDASDESTTEHTYDADNLILSPDFGDPHDQTHDEPQNHQHEPSPDQGAGQMIVSTLTGSKVLVSKRAPKSIRHDFLTEIEELSCFEQKAIEREDTDFITGRELRSGGLSGGLLQMIITDKNKTLDSVFTPMVECLAAMIPDMPLQTLWGICATDGVKDNFDKLPKGTVPDYARHANCVKKNYVASMRIIEKKKRIKQHNNNIKARLQSFQARNSAFTKAQEAETAAQQCLQTYLNSSATADIVEKAKQTVLSTTYILEKLQEDGWDQPFSGEHDPQIVKSRVSIDAEERALDNFVKRANRCIDHSMLTGSKLNRDPIYPIDASVEFYTGKFLEIWTLCVEQVVGNCARYPQLFRQNDTAEKRASFSSGLRGFFPWPVTPTPLDAPDAPVAPVAAGAAGASGG